MRWSDWQPWALCIIATTLAVQSWFMLKQSERQAEIMRRQAELSAMQTELMKARLIQMGNPR